MFMLGLGEEFKEIIKEETLSKSKIITATRDAGTSSGDISYTGVGFKPSSIRAIMTVDGTLYTSDGSADSRRRSFCNYVASDNVNYISSSTLITYSNRFAWAQNADVKSYDEDGFTLSWDKAGTPTAGIMQLMFICYK